MLNKHRTGVTICLLEQLSEKRIGKTSMQKLVYFLQEFGVDLNYKYEMYHYGPYCFELSNDLDLLNMMNIISIEDNPTTYGYSIKLSNSVNGSYFSRNESCFESEAQHAWDNYKSGFEKLLKIFGECSTRDLELYATMHFVGRILRERGKVVDADDVIREVKFLKPKYSKDELENAYQYLSENLIVPL